MAHRRSPNLLSRFILSKYCTIVRKNHYLCNRNNQQNDYMEQSRGLNAAQMDFLRLLGHFTTEEQVEELRQVVCNYYASKIDEAIDKLWDEGRWDNEKNEAILKEHLRTPYNYAN